MKDVSLVEENGGEETCFFVFIRVYPVSSVPQPEASINSSLLAVTFLSPSIIHLFITFYLLMNKSHFNLCRYLLLNSNLSRPPQTSLFN